MASRHSFDTASSGPDIKSKGKPNMPRHKPPYPNDWKRISYAIRFTRAHGRCECLGECGLHHTHPGPRRCVEQHLQPAQWAKGHIILTAAHLCACDPLCDEPTHLKAMCQRCHLRVDTALHGRHSAETRRKQKESEGQLSFLAV